MPNCPEGETYDRVEKRCRKKKSPGRGGLNTFYHVERKPLDIRPVQPVLSEIEKCKIKVQLLEAKLESKEQRKEFKYGIATQADADRFFKSRPAAQS